MEVIAAFEALKHFSIIRSFLMMLGVGTEGGETEGRLRVEGP